MSPKRVLLSWSSGKDSAWMLHVLRQRHDAEPAALVTTFDETSGCAGMHGVPRALVEEQARACQLPLWSLLLPWPASNNTYELRMRELAARAKAHGITHIAFGDLYLEDIRNYRTQLFEGSGIEPVFPIWCGKEAVPSLARDMIRAGIQATVACVDTKQIPEGYAGRAYDGEFLAALPPHADPCGEKGEFHTFCYAGPHQQGAIPFVPGPRKRNENFVYSAPAALVA